LALRHKITSLLLLSVILALSALFLSWCSSLPVGGYCVKDTTKSVVKEVEGQIIIEQGYTVCYDAKGNVKEESE